MRAVNALSSVDAELTLPSEPRSVATARNAMSELARRVGASAEDVRLAVSEAVANAVLHGYRGRRPGTIAVSGKLERGRLLIKVADDGIGMTPNLDSKGLGLGLSVISKLAADVRFISSQEGTTVAMTFETDGAGGSD